MAIYYQGTDITDMVQTRACIIRDGAGERCDSLKLEFENAAGWYRWGPQEDDQIIVTHSGYHSGVMYVNSIVPADGRYSIWATALPCRARTSENRSYINETIDGIMRICAMTSGMEFQLFGIDKQTFVPYAEQDNEWNAAFLDRLLTLEGAALKCVNGKYTAIGIQYAQDLPTARTLEIYSQQEGVKYTRSGTALKAVTVLSPYACASAEDTAVSGRHSRLTISAPVISDVQAGRWARGKLLNHNRKCEMVAMQNEFDPAFTAMMRIDIQGDTDASGEWLIEEVTHDLVDLTSMVKMRRCIRTIQ